MDYWIMAFYYVGLIFGVQEGYPLMHPLIILAQKPSLLWILSFFGKLLLTVLFLLMPMSIAALLWYKSLYAWLFLCIVIMPWVFCFKELEWKHMSWHSNIKSLPCMICSTTDDSIVVIKIIGQQLKKIITQHPTTEIVVMPESACNIDNFLEISELLQLWNKESIGKAIHFIFGASRREGDNCYNSLYWVYDGNLQQYHDKQHAMLLTERLSVLIDYNCLRIIYFKDRQPITISLCERKKFALLNDTAFVPYICSELFFNESVDDNGKKDPILAVINDSLFLAHFWTRYIHTLLILLARFKAIQWQRNIVYVSYAQSLFIDECGRCKEINE